MVEQNSGMRRGKSFGNDIPLNRTPKRCREVQDVNGRELAEQLYRMARENKKATWEQIVGVVNAILAVYMARGLDYDAEQAINTMRRFNMTDVLSF